jgi:hypothetical protein
MINHQHRPRPFFIACYMQEYNSIFSKENESLADMKVSNGS